MRGMLFGTSADDSIGRCAIPRHSVRSPSRAPPAYVPSQPLPGAITVGFADDHSRLVKLEDLWALNWHVDWQTSVRRPGLGRWLLKSRR